MSGNMEVAQSEMYESTLDESVMETLMRDGKVIYGKLRIVLFGNVSNPEIQKHIDDWDMWGPLLIGVINAFFISVNSYYSAGSSVLFSLLIIVQWVGGFLLAVHSKMLKLNVSYFQMISALGYSLVPITFYNIITGTVPLPFKGVLGSLVLFASACGCLFWSMRTFNVFMSKAVDNRRRWLAIIPAGVYFWFFIMNGINLH